MYLRYKRRRVNYTNDNDPMFFFWPFISDTVMWQEFSFMTLDQTQHDSQFIFKIKHLFNDQTQKTQSHKCFSCYANPITISNMYGQPDLRTPLVQNHLSSCNLFYLKLPLIRTPC